MIVPDANLLLYAYDTASPFHASARGWWAGCLSGREAVGLTHATLFAFLRVGTSARVYEQPLTLREAADHVRSWLQRSVTRLLLPDDGHLARAVETSSRMPRSPRAAHVRRTDRKLLAPDPPL